MPILIGDAPPLADAGAPTQEQLLILAHELKQALKNERRTSTQLSIALEQLRSLAADLENALSAERHIRQDLELAHRDTIRRLIQASRFKHEETGAHIQRVSTYSLALARHLGLPEEDIQTLVEAAPMHDLGKIGIPDAILRKPGALSREERSVMQTHTTIGAELLRDSKSSLIRTAWEIALTHHERWDGSGYPRGLRGAEIPMSGRIVVLADYYDAMRSERCYKPAHSHSRTCDSIFKGDGRTSPAHFDPAVLEAFRALESEFDRIFNASRKRLTGV
jgi:putative two-component system response regulator